VTDVISFTSAWLQMTGQLHLPSQFSASRRDRLGAMKPVSNLDHNCMTFWSQSVPGSSWRSRGHFALRGHGNARGRLFRVAKGQIFIALPLAFQFKSAQGSLHTVRSQQNWPSNLSWFFTVYFQQYSEKLYLLTVGTISTRANLLQIPLTTCLRVHQHASAPHCYRK
jgi:hypothetical protein